MASPFRASYGGVELLVDTIEGDTGRDWAVQSPHRGDEHPVQDQGKRLRRAACSIRFVDQPGLADDYLDRYLAFEAMANDGRPQIFVHPMHGGYLAVVEAPSYSVSADSREVTCDCTFLAVQEPRAVQSMGAGVSAVAGPEEVGVEVATTTAALAEIDWGVGVQPPTTTTPADCLTAAEAWATADDADARAILLQVSSLTTRIDADIARMDLLTDYARWPLYQAYIRLRYSVQRAATAATVSTSRVVGYTVRVATPLRALCARLYGAREAEERAAQVARINGVRVPGLVPAGTTLMVPSEGLGA